MGTRYIFDSNIFIELQRRQPIDVYPSVWEKISELMEKGVVVSCQEVYEEILVGHDSLATWVKQRASFFIPTTEEVQTEVRSILANYRGLVEGGKKKNSADPFVIALARLSGYAVVSQEARSNNMNSPKIPNVCSELGIKCLTFIDFSREMKLVF